MRFTSLVFLVFLCPIWAAESDKVDFDPMDALKELCLEPGSDTAAILEKLREIAVQEDSFHSERVELEVVFAGQLDGRQGLEDFTRKVFQLAASRQRKIKSLARDLRGMLRGPTRKRFAAIALPDLTDPGKTVYGMFRRPSSSSETSRMRDARNETMGSGPPRTLETIFDHTVHPQLKKGCVHCHTSNNRKRIKKAFDDEQTRESCESLYWWRYRRNELIPEMKRCMECHKSGQAQASCTLCHPDYDEETILSDSYNPYSWLKAGMPAPAFRLETLDGKEVDSAIPLAGGYLVVQFGSSTSSLYLRQVDNTNALVEKYADRPVTFLTVYTKESHPELIAGENWIPANQADLATRARICRNTLTERGIRDGSLLVVDDWPGRVNRLYGGFPNSVFIIDPTGRIAWRAAWCRVDHVDEKLNELLGRNGKK